MLSKQRALLTVISCNKKFTKINFRIWRRWKDKRLVEGDQNKHRETECPSNDIIDWGVYAPGDLQIVQTKAKVTYSNPKKQNGIRDDQNFTECIFRNLEIGQASNSTPPKGECLNLYTDLMSR